MRQYSKNANFSSAICKDATTFIIVIEWQFYHMYIICVTFSMKHLCIYVLLNMACIAFKVCAK